MRPNLMPLTSDKEKNQMAVLIFLRQEAWVYYDEMFEL
jgi:hypothetical protein